ncbi:hypothetical protein BDV11DRAFT_173289 [Aspergillus similis]
MLATQMPPPASHLRSSSSSGAEASASLPVMSPALPPQHQHPAAPGAHPHSSMSCGLSSQAPARPALSRPKLTLQTSSLPMSFSTSSTGLSLSLATGPTASPTVRNTFKNAYDVTYPSSAAVSPSRSASNRFSKPSSPYTPSNPYQLPIGVKSILRNSYLESAKRRSNSVGPSSAAARRVFFPTKKQVSYRYPLEEEIKTVKYTAAHSDLVSDSEPGSCETSSDDDSDYSTSSLVSSDTTPSDEETNTAEKKKKKRKYRSNERQVRAVALMEGLKDPYSSQSQTPQTPRQGRLKRRREWRWTLGPLEEAGTTTDSSQFSAPNTQAPAPSGSERNQDSEEPNTPEPNTSEPNTTSTAPSEPPPQPLPVSLPAHHDTPDANNAPSSGPEESDPKPPQ